MKKENGFTMIELMVIVSILGILCAVISPRLGLLLGVLIPVATGLCIMGIIFWDEIFDILKKWGEKIEFK